MASQHSHRPSHSKSAPLSPPPTRPAQPASDHLALSDLLDAPGDVAAHDHAGDDLLSRMAGDSIDRMISGEFEPIVDPVDQLKDQLGNFFEELHQRQHVVSVSPKSVLPRPATPSPTAARPSLRVAPPPAPMSATAVAEEQMEIVAPAERAALSFDGDESPLTDDGDEITDAPLRLPAAPQAPAAPAGRGPRALLVHPDPGHADAVPLPLQPFDWAGGVVETMSPAARALLSVGAVASFVAACGTLAYVLVLRQGW